MKTTERSMAQHTAGGLRTARPGIERSGFGERTPGANLPENGGPEKKSRDAEVRLHVVATRQTADPAQVPWLDEISARPRVNEASSGII